MGTTERLHRPDLERSAPRRHAATYLRDAPAADAAQRAAEAVGAIDAAQAAAADGTHPPQAGADSAVAHGVRVGYEVIEAQILQGQQLAQRLARATLRFGAGGLNGLDGLHGHHGLNGQHGVNGLNGLNGGAAAQAPDGAAADAGDAATDSEFNPLIERVLHLYKDLGALCLDAVETLARSPALRSGLARAAQGLQAGLGPAPGEPAAPAAAAAGISVEVSSTLRTQVTLELLPPTGRFTPRVHALHAADPAVPPLTGVRFVAEGGREDGGAVSGRPLLQIEVPAGQPPGSYTGVVVDSASNAPRGTLLVRLLARPPV